MFKNKALSFIAAFLLIGILTACTGAASSPTAIPEANQPAAESSSPAAAQPEQPAATEASQPSQAPTALSDAEMEAFIQTKLEGSPHTLTFILEQDRDAEDWSEILDRMIGYGAKINPEEKQLIIDWLVSR
ncbi:MAG: hypothetical protein AAGU04_00005 [Anaerolineaceae bacterium]